MNLRDFFGSHLREAREILKNPPIERVCAHGLALRNMQLPEGGWAGGVNECVCCYGTFGYIDSAWWGPRRTKTHTWTPKTLCATCGGRYVDYDSDVPVGAGTL